MTLANWKFGQRDAVARNPRQFLNKGERMKSDVQKEINKLLQLKNAFEEARSAYGSQFSVVSNLLTCPVCPGNARLGKNFGRYEIKCDNCGFHVGQSDDLKEMLDLWTAVCDTIEETKKDEVKEYE